MNASSVAAPMPLYTRDSSVSPSPSLSRPSSSDLQSFGYTFSSGTVDSRHDRRLSSSSFTETLPPTYSESHRDILPEYAPNYEPVTLAMYLFRFGFLFPPFWLLGSLILFSPLRTPSSSESDDQETTIGAWLPEKTEAERKTFISHMRKAELKWARRCLAALLIFLVVAGIITGVAVWALAK